METAFKMLKRMRVSLLETLETFTKDQLLVIPEGFNNNILWNAGHMIVSQQLLSYGLCGLELGVSNDMLARYRKGTSPLAWQSKVDSDELKTLTISLVERTANDVQKGLFAAAPNTHFPYSTSFCGDLETLDDAVHFNNLHEGLHLGTIRTLEKFV